MTAARAWTRVGHRVLNFLLIGGVVVQFYAAGWAAFGMPFTFHAVLGWCLIAASLLALPIAAVGHGRSRITLMSAALVLVLVMQPVFVFVLSAVSVHLTALHAVNGLLAFSLVVATEIRSRRATKGPS